MSVLSCGVGHGCILGTPKKGAVRRWSRRIPVLAFVRNLQQHKQHRFPQNSALNLEYKRKSRQAQLFKATEKEGEEGTSVLDATSSASVENKKVQAKGAKEKGQLTAVVTGAIAVMLGVGYLILVQLLDTRGLNLEPPPPEAFGP